MIREAGIKSGMMKAAGLVDRAKKRLGIKTEEEKKKEKRKARLKAVAKGVGAAAVLGGTGLAAHQIGHGQGVESGKKQGFKRGRFEGKRVGRAQGEREARRDAYQRFAWDLDSAETGSKRAKERLKRIRNIGDENWKSNFRWSDASK